MSTDVDALELLPAEESDETQVGFVTGCDVFTYCFDTCTRN
ncbi:ALQxL family class IV lanthipeptide [Dactylosporangium sp. NPDC049140]